MMFIETSAKEKIGVNEAFEEVVNKVIESPMVETISLGRSGIRGNNGPTVKLHQNPNTNGTNGITYSNQQNPQQQGYCCGQ